MAFQPFGYGFEIRAPMRHVDAVAAIRARLKGWFDPNQGARGWILGPFLCLWSSAFNRNGPMVLARIIDYGFSTRIRGRAGSDLNGTIWLTILGFLMLCLFWQEANSGRASGEPLLIYGGVFVVLVPLILWLSHSDRHEADHLVRFLDDVVTPAAKSRRMTAASLKMLNPFEMDVSGEKAKHPVTGDSIYEAVLATGIGDFVILASDAETYIQALGQEAGLVIEKREGSGDQHYRAIRRGRVGDMMNFTFQETWDVLTAYLSGSPEPPFLEWERMSTGTDPYAAE